MSKLSFRARALDASKPMPIYMAEELPDLPDYSAINRAVPQMPSGMHKEEECEHHLQRAICTGLIIPTPEVTDLADVDAYNKIYPADYKLPRQLIHVQPFAMEQDIPDYDMDSEDEKWIGVQQSRKMDLTPLQFEEMMDRLEKSSGQTVVTLNEAKALLKEDDDLIIAVFDYWLNKRLKTQHPLLLTVKTEHRLGSAANNPYLAFRRRMEKMQTRKIRKNDEISYEKMLKLRRDLSRAVTLLELVKRREKTKREHLHLTIEIYEKRYQAQDFNGQILAEVSALKATRPAFAPLFTNQFGVHQNWTNKVCGKDEVVPRREKRQYKKRKHKADARGRAVDDGGMRSSTGGSGGSRGNRAVLGSGLDPLASSDDDSPLPSHSHSHSHPHSHTHVQQSLLSLDRDDDDTMTVTVAGTGGTVAVSNAADEGQFAFRRSRHGAYLPPVSGGFGNWPWCDINEGGLADKKYRFALTSVRKPVQRCIGLARRRIGRGGRILLDRCTDAEDPWSSLDFKIQHGIADPTVTAATTTKNKDWLHFRPKTPPVSCEHNPSLGSSDSECESDQLSSRQEQPLPYPFPADTISICVDIESGDHPGDEPPFTAEFNISDYFPVEASMPDFTFEATTNLGGNSGSGGGGDGGAVDCRVSGLSRDNTHYPRTDELGSSRFALSPEIGNSFTQPPTQQVRPQCSSDSVGNSTSDCYFYSSSLSFLTTPSFTSSSSSSSSSSPSPSSSAVSSLTCSSLCTTTQHQQVSIPCTVSIQCTNVTTETQPSHLLKQQHQHRQLANNGNAASLQSKPSTSPTNSKSSSSGNNGNVGLRVLGAANTTVCTTVSNFANCHQNGPIMHHIHNSNNFSNSTHTINSQSSSSSTSSSTTTILLPQKHPPSNLLPGLIAQTKLANLARQQQQAQNQTQQIPTSGEITLNSNSEGLDMEVVEHRVEGSACESKSQQQQLVRPSKTNSLAMEVT